MDTKNIAELVRKPLNFPTDNRYRTNEDYIEGKLRLIYPEAEYFAIPQRESDKSRFEGDWHIYHSSSDSSIDDAVGAFCAINYVPDWISIGLKGKRPSKKNKVNVIPEKIPKTMFAGFYNHLGENASIDDELEPVKETAEALSRYVLEPKNKNAASKGNNPRAYAALISTEVVAGFAGLYPLIESFVAIDDVDSIENVRETLNMPVSLFDIGNFPGFDIPWIAAAACGIAPLVAGYLVWKTSRAARNSILKSDEKSLSNLPDIAFNYMYGPDAVNFVSQGIENYFKNKGIRGITGLISSLSDKEIDIKDVESLWEYKENLGEEPSNYFLEGITSALAPPQDNLNEFQNKEPALLEDDSTDEPVVELEDPESFEKRYDTDNEDN
ncbi:MAG: hypothetical protein ACLFUO_06380 [Candidatus Woesearchaeota archaeon]